MTRKGKKGPGSPTTPGPKNQQSKPKGDGSAESVAVQNLEGQPNQMDLFSFSHGLYTDRPRFKHKPCLDCGLVNLQQEFSVEKGIYVGDRICVTCKGLNKRRYAE